MRIAHHVASYKRLIVVALFAAIVLILFAISVANSHALSMQSCPPPPCDPSIDPNCRPSQPASNFTTPPLDCPPEGCPCTPPKQSPIIIDVERQGFQLTSAKDGVQFDISGTGKLVQIAWTASGSRNAFLALDRDGDGYITSGKELFGNFTAQAKSDYPNGFLALAEFDKPINGGNGDGVLDQRDAIFADLRLWVDLNHNGISEPGELFKLPELGVFSLSLRYKETRRTDQYGNLFRFKARVNVTGQPPEHSEAPVTAYDVFLTTDID